MSVPFSASSAAEVIDTHPLAARLAMLRSLPYFAVLDETDLQKLAAQIIEWKFGKGQTIFLEGDPCNGVYFVREGQVRIYKLAPDGREQVLRYATIGQTFNEVAVFDRGPNPAHVNAVTATVLWVVPRDLIWELARTRPAFAVAIIQNLGKQLRQLVGLVETLSLRSVTARLAHLLLEIASEEGASHVMTQQEMAARLGTVREMVGRSLKQLETKGLIKIERGRIVIVDRKALQEIM